jgi:two-component system cell cycle sensor histidine kinase/response regulator CckA
MDQDTVHILLVEDEEAHAELVRRAFRSRAPSVHLTVAGSLEEAQALQAKHPPDLIIADLFLPDGRATELLPDKGVLNGFPVVIMTSHGDEQIAVEAIKAGALDYVVKSPAIMADMPHIAQRALREWRHIVERKLADEALKESEEKLRLIFERAFDGICIYEELPGRQRRLMDCNKRYAEMAGRSKEELLEITDFGSIQHKLEPSRNDEENVRIRNAGLTYRGRFSWVRPDRRENIIEYSAAPIQVGERALTIGVDRDITEWVQAEEALKEYSERLEAMVAERTAEVEAQYAQLDAILSSVGDAIMMADRELRIRYVNPAFTALTGYTAMEALGQLATAIGAGTDSDQVRQFIASASAKGKPWLGEVTGRRKDGRAYDAVLTVAPVYDAEGHVMGYVSSHHDVSQRKALERARNQFITSVSHQFRTPVATLQLTTYLMQQTEPPEALSHHLEAMEKQIEWLVRLIQDTLEMTMLDSGDAITYRRPISMPALIEGTIARYQTRAETSNLALAAMPVPADLPIVEGDQSRLAQALGELVENAIAFTPAGGEVTLELAALRIEGRSWVAIEVRDTGPGISPEEQERVFDRFFRGSPAEAGQVPGTGLGLSIAYEIVRAHGGRITVESQLGHGATFTIWLPA